MPAGAVPFPFGVCRICKDKATGVHYGVATCEGCKGFFKRSISKADKYKCFFGGECDVNPKNRNRCKSCRYRKCLDTGMSVEAVKMGRIPKVEKEKALEALLYPSTSEATVEMKESEVSVETSISNAQFYGQNKSLEKINLCQYDYGCDNMQPEQSVPMTTSQVGPPTSCIQTSSGYGNDWQKQISQGQGITQTQPHFTNSLPPAGASNSKIRFEHRLSSSDSHIEAQPYQGYHGNHVPYDFHHRQHRNMQGNNQYHNSTKDVHTLSEVKSENEDINEFSEQHHHHGNKQSNSYHQQHMPMELTSDIRQMHFEARTEAEKTIPLTNSINVESRQNHIPGEAGPPPCNGSHSEHFENTPKHYPALPLSDNVRMEVTYPHQQGNLSGPSRRQYYSQSAQNTDVTTAYHSMPKTVLSTSMSHTEKKYGERLTLEIHNQRTNATTPPGRPASTPSLCQTPSSVEGSSSSSQRNPYSPALIKVLIEQVVDTMGKQEVAQKLVQQLRQNKLDSRTMSTLMTIVKEVSNGDKTTSSPHGKSSRRSTEVLPDQESLSFESEQQQNMPKLSDNKMASINRFLDDVDRYSSSHSGSQKNWYGEHDLGFAEDTNSTSCNVSWQQSTDSKKDSSSMIVIPDNQRANTISDLSESEFSAVVSCNALSNDAEMLGLRKHYDSSSATSGIPRYENGNSNYDSNHCGGSSHYKGKQSKDDGKQQLMKNYLDQLQEAKTVLYQQSAKDREILRLRKFGLLDIEDTGSTPEQVKEAYHFIISGIPKLNERILGFSKSVPGFTNLNVEDQERLLKKAYYDIWMLVHSEFFYPDGSVNIVLRCGRIYVRSTMEAIINEEVVKTMCEFADQFNALKLTDLEVVIVCAIRLSCTDNLEMSNKKAVDDLHFIMLDILASEVVKNHPETHSRILIDIFRLMPLLENINKLQKNFIASFKVSDEANTTTSPHPDQSSNSYR